MYPPKFDYVRAGSVEDAISQVTSSDGKLLAGGHSLLPVMKMRLADPGTLVDIGNACGTAVSIDQKRWKPFIRAVVIVQGEAQVL